VDSQFELKSMSETDPGNNLPSQAVLAHFLGAHFPVAHFPAAHFPAAHFWLHCVVRKPNPHDNSLCFLRAACLKHIHHFSLHYKTLSLSFARTFGPWFREKT
jgi:hypothetical protein